MRGKGKFVKSHENAKKVGEFRNSHLCNNLATYTYIQ